MAKRGPHPTANHLKAIAGTERLDRSTVLAFEVANHDPCLPADFEDLKNSKPLVAARLLRTWNGYVAKFSGRGQKVADFENALYSLCALEVRIRMLEERGDEVPMAMVNGHRVYLNEFHLTPAGNIKPAGTPAGNKFANNGKPKSA